MRHARSVVPVAALFAAILLPSCQKSASVSAVNDYPAEAQMEPQPSAEADEMMKMDREEAAAPEAKPKPGSKDAADASTWKRSQIQANTSRIKVGDDRELPIRGLEARVRIDGFRARVLLDYYFENPDDQQYEGSFTVRLPTGASPYFLAFGQSQETLDAIKAPDRFADMQQPEAFEPEEVMVRRAAGWIEPKEARIVPKEKAAYAFGETVRRQVDPALMEWAGPGMFNAKLFPIAAKKLHRVVIGYDTNLTPIGADYEFTIPLPESGDSTRLHVAVAKADGMGIAVEPRGAADDSPATAYYSWQDPEQRVVKVRLQKLAAARLDGVDDVGPYFAAQFVPELPAQPARTSARDALFLVDTSLSSNPDRFNVWLKLMKAILEKNRATMPNFAVVFFNVASFSARAGWLPNTAQAVAEMDALAQTLALEGATDLGQLLDHVAKSGLLAGRQADIFLLSDAAVTWGDADAYALTQRLGAGGPAVFAYRTGMSGDDAAMMEHFARETGGAVFSVVGESEIPTAAVAHTQPPWTIRGITAAGATDVLLAGRPKTLFGGQRLTVVGRGAPPGPFTLQLARGAEKVDVRVEVKQRFASSLAARVYGQIAVGQLEEFLGATRTFAEAYARHYRVPGASSSLLMLESEEDYARFGIVPQNDVEVVRTHLAYDRVMTALDELILKLGDPKAAFLAWIAHAKTLPGVMLAPSDAVSNLLDALPQQAFTVRQTPLDTKRHDRAAVSKPLLEQLAIQKPEYDTVTADAQSRHKQIGAADALKALSSLVEANPGDTVLARDVGYTAALWGFPRQAFHLFRRVAEARPYEPQTYHAMANTLAASGMPDLALVYFEIALSGEWDARFGEFRQIVELDYLGFLRKTKPEALHPAARAHAAQRKAALTQSVSVDDADVVVVIAWNTDRTDIDLHVIEPTGEECYYSHPETKIGGRLTRDVTTGYGPEMYVLKKAPRGKFQVRVKYYASDANRASTRTKVDAVVYENWGKPTERVTRKVVTLQTGEEMHDILTFKR